ncbi:MAG: 50S ribosomal protein L32 [Armatimonadetes bacterium]|nr:50S ribosomal protein L32 [Armatimonadota bacterium]
MPLPKRRHSSTRQAKRRTHYKLDAPSVSTCTNCGETRRSYQICANCGYYSGRIWFTPKPAKETAEAA